MSRPSIGAMRHRLVLEAVSRAGDGGGGATETWDPVAEVWAAVTPMTGDETVAAEALTGRITHVVHIRHRPGVLPAMRLRFGARRLEIVAVMDTDERRRRLKILCRERDL